MQLGTVRNKMRHRCILAYDQSEVTVTKCFDYSSAHSMWSKHFVATPNRCRYTRPWLIDCGASTVALDRDISHIQGFDSGIFHNNCKFKLTNWLHMLVDLFRSAPNCKFRPRHPNNSTSGSRFEPSTVTRRAIVQNLHLLTTVRPQPILIAQRITFYSGLHENSIFLSRERGKVMD